MSVIKPIPDDANIAMVYVTPAGIIVSVGRGFNNLFGHDIAEHVGKPLRSICKEPEEFNKLLSGAVASPTTSGLVRAASSVEGQDVGNLTIMHKFGDEITVKVKIMKVNTSSACSTSIVRALADRSSHGKNASAVIAVIAAVLISCMLR